MNDAMQWIGVENRTDTRNEKKLDQNLHLKNLLQYEQFNLIQFSLHKKKKKKKKKKKYKHDG